MLMRGITPPRLGSVRDRIMTEMYVRERVVEQDKLATLTLVLVNLMGVKPEAAERIQALLKSHSDRLTFREWSIDTRKEEQVKVKTDLDLLDMVNKLGRK